MSAAERFALRLGEFDALLARLNEQRNKLFGVDLEAVDWADVAAMLRRTEAVRFAINQSLDR